METHGGAVVFTVVAGALLARALVRSFARLQQMEKWKNEKSHDLGSAFGFDIGGTLSKVVYFYRTAPKTPTSRGKRSESYISAVEQMKDFLLQNVTYGASGTRDTSLSVKSKRLGGEIHFIRFETKRMTEAMQVLALAGVHQSVMSLYSTGGGAHKFSTAFKEQLAIDMHTCDELECLVSGLNFLLHEVPNEVYTFTNIDLGTLSATKTMVKTENAEDLFPYLLVNIGSGVSILKVEGPGKISRVSGTSLGGGTFWGLCKLLTKCKTFDEAMDLSELGDNTKVDMSVGDIYGGDYGKFDLPASTVASSFGRMGMKDSPGDDASEADIARGLLSMITQNIGQVAYLCAKQHHLKKIIFVGNFLRYNKVSTILLAHFISYWSKQQTSAHFMKHEGYFGALGAFLNIAATNKAETKNLVPELVLPKTVSPRKGNASEGRAPTIRERRSAGHASTDGGHVPRTA
jgi:type II pantothenate kinase